MNTGSWSIGGTRFPPVLLLLFSFLLLFATISSSQAQINPALADTGLVRPDTLAAGTVVDSAARTGNDIDTVVTYAARDSITYSMQTRNMKIFGQGEIDYRTMGLKSNEIAMNWDTATLEAVGTKSETDSGKPTVVGAPILIDGGEEYNGSRVRYNFRTRKGKITLADTEIEEGYYHGEDIKKIDADVLYVRNGRYTTCDVADPHYFFMSPKMKVLVGDVVVAEPVYFYIADVPVFALPFGVFPNRAGRRSGLIAPAYGFDERFGYYLSHLGYYWAISDYMDLGSTMDIYSKGGWALHSLFRYALRYNFTGSLGVDFTNRNEGEAGDPTRTEQRDYSVRLTHNQQIDPSTNLNVNFTWTSGQYYRNYSTNLNDILRQNIVSNATITKNWSEHNRSLSLYVRRDQSLVTDEVTELLPQISFSQGQFFPFRRGKGIGSGGASGGARWYETVGLSYNATASNSRAKTLVKVDSVQTAPGSPDFTTVDAFRTTGTQTINQDVRIGVSPKFGYINVSPSFTFRDERSFSTIDVPFRNPFDSTSVTSRTDKGRSDRGVLTAALGTSTRLFGIVQPDVWGVKAVRHTFSPNLSFSYSKQVYGSNPPPPYAMTASLNIQNLFEMKYQPVDTVKEEKVQLMNIGLSTSYNFNAPEFRLSPLSITYRTAIGNYFNLNASTSYDFYVFDQTLNQRVNKLLIKEKGYLARLTSVSLSISTSLSGERSGTGSTVPSAVQQEQERASGLLPSPGMDQSTSSFFTQEEPDFNIPWSLNLIFSFSQSQQNPTQKIRNASISANLSFSLTDKWKITASGNYNLTQKQFASPTINVTRDLHCWLMNFSWQPLGFYRGYRMEIRVKARALQDLKVTKQGSQRGVYR